MRRTISHVDNFAHCFGLLTMNPGDDRKLWIYGYVRYMDGLSTGERKYGWARQYDPILSTVSRKFRFAHVNKSGYNYAD